MLDDHPSPSIDEINGDNPPGDNPHGDNPPYVRPAPPKTKKAKPGAGQRSASGRIIFPSASERPCHRDYMHSFQVEGDKSDKWHRPGIYYHWVHEKTDRDGSVTATLQDTWILSWLRVLAIVRTDAGQEHSYLLEYLEHGEGSPKRLILPQSMLVGRGEEAFRLLRSRGIRTLNKNIKLACNYLDELHLQFNAAHPEDFWIQTKMVGWYSDGTFILPNKIIGVNAGVCFSGDSKAAASYKTKGSFKEWDTNIAQLCSGNDYLIRGLASSLTGPLLKRLNLTGIGLHYYGDSSEGKTTSARVACSSWGGPDYLKTWYNTGNALEGHAAAKNDTFLALDDAQQCPSKIIDASLYFLFNGVPKGRMSRDAELKEAQIYRPAILSTGEHSVEAKLNADRLTHQAGQAMRLVDVPVHAAYGAFDDLHGSASGREFSERLTRACAQHYGHAGPKFILELINKKPNLHAQLDVIRQEFGTDLSAQEGRVARAFACVALAGNLAIEWKIFPWAEGSVLSAAKNIFKRWREAQPQSSKSREHAQILKKIADFIDVHANARFLDMSWKAGKDRYGTDEKPPVLDHQAGYFEDNGTGERIFLFTSAGLRAATPGFDINRVTRALEEAGAFTVQGTDEKAKQRRTPDKRNPKLYHIDPAKLA